MGDMNNRIDVTFTKEFVEDLFSEDYINNGTALTGFPKKKIDQPNNKMWSVHGHDYYACERAVSALEPGQYNIYRDGRGTVYFSRAMLNMDDLLVLPDSKSDEVIRGIENFWDRKDFFNEFGFLWKRGVLLYGPPGSGKTSTVQLLSKQIVDKGGLSLYVTNPHNGSDGLEILRRIEPDRPIVVIIEDIDSIIDEYGENNLLALLDGERQINNVVFVATTNYPERLDKRLVNRPSRFDEVVFIGMPNPEARRLFLTKKNPRLLENTEELERWVSLSNDFSVAHLKEMIVSVECLGNSFEATVEKLRTMIDKDITSDKFNKKKNTVGFNEGE